MTPYDNLKSLFDAEPGGSFKGLDDIATKQSDLDIWGQMQKTRAKLFDTIFGQTPFTT